MRYQRWLQLRKKPSFYQLTYRSLARSTGDGKKWPPLILAGCDEPLVPDAPDLRGVWQVYKGPLKGHIERNEQAGPRVVIAAGGIIHDLTVGASPMVDEGIGGAKISVTARYENKRLNLYLNGKRLVVTLQTWRGHGVEVGAVRESSPTSNRPASELTPCELTELHCFTCRAGLHHPTRQQVARLYLANSLECVSRGRRCPAWASGV